MELILKRGGKSLPFWENFRQTHKWDTSESFGAVMKRRSFILQKYHARFGDKYGAYLIFENEEDMTRFIMEWS